MVEMSISINGTTKSWSIPNDKATKIFDKLCNVWKYQGEETKAEFVINNLISYLRNSYGGNKRKDDLSAAVDTAQSTIDAEIEDDLDW